MPWTFNPFIGNFDYYRAGSTSSPTDLATFDYIDSTDFLFIDGAGFDFIT